MSGPVEIAWASLAAGAVALALGVAPLGVLLIARRMSLMGDALSHAILPGAAVAYMLSGPDPAALTLGALIAGAAVAGGSTLLARSGRLAEDAAFAVLYLPALALGVLLFGHEEGSHLLEAMLFGDGLDRAGLVLAASAATATLFALAVFGRGFLAEGADPLFVRAAGLKGGLLHLLLMTLVAVNLVAGFRAFGALMTVGLMMIPAAAARFWAKTWLGQSAVAVLGAVLAGGTGLWLAHRFEAEPGAAMVLSAAALFAVSALAGPRHSLIAALPRRSHLEG